MHRTHSPFTLASPSTVNGSRRSTARRVLTVIGALVGSTLALLPAQPASAAVDHPTVAFTSSGCRAWTTPEDVAGLVRITVIGSAGQNYAAPLAGEPAWGGNGDGMSAELTIYPGQQYTVCVNEGGGATGSGQLPPYVGRGGGASSFGSGGVDTGAPNGFMYIIAGGGGGAGSDNGAISNGGDAGYPDGKTGNNGVGPTGTLSGKGATSTAPGIGGTTCEPGIGGTGTGADLSTNLRPGSGGRGADSSSNLGGAGGGGGLYGGGGGIGTSACGGLGIRQAGAGGGGSSYCLTTLLTCTHTAGAGAVYGAGPGEGQAKVVVENLKRLQPGSLTVSPTEFTIGQGPFTLTTTGPGDLSSVWYQVTNQGETGCTTNGATLTVTAAGTCSVRAVRPGDADYLDQYSAFTPITINPPEPRENVVTVTGGQPFGGTPSFSYDAGSLPDGVTVSGTPTCTTVNSGTPIDAALARGDYTLDSGSCSGLTLTSANPGDFLTLVGSTFNVGKAPITIRVAIERRQGKTKAIYQNWYPLNQPNGVSVTGSFTCATVDGGTPISANLTEGTYQVDGASCSGLVLSGPDADNYRLEYQGAVSVAAPATSCGDPVYTGRTGRVTCHYTGNYQFFTPPPGVSSVQVEAWGAQGGDNLYDTATGGTGGLGGHTTGTLPVAQGESFQVIVGGVPDGIRGGFGGGGSANELDHRGRAAGNAGGGGGSFVENDDDVNLLVAGGGGGAGTRCIDNANSAPSGGTGGGTTGGAGGSQGTGCGLGGAGGSGPGTPGIGTAASALPGRGGGGGGGGYVGGAAGGLSAFTGTSSYDTTGGGGGGGSGYAPPGGTTENGVRTGNGLVVFTFDRTLAVTVTGSKNVGAAATFSPSFQAPEGVTVEGSVSCSSVVNPSGSINDPALPVGGYTIDRSSCSGLTLSGPNAGDYAVGYVGSDFTVNDVTEVAVTVTGTQTYGGQPTFSVPGGLPAGVHTTGTLTCTGLVGGTTIAPTLSAGGTYGIKGSTCSGLAADSGYVLQLLDGGSFSVNRAGLTVTAASPTITYGQPVPAITRTITGFVNGENASVLTGTITCSTTATGTSGAGSYPTSCAGPATDGNYTLGYTAGSLTINRAPLTVLPDSPSVVYGDAIATIGRTITGFVNGETASVLSGTISCTTTATAASPVGDYLTSCSGPPTDGNYQLTYPTGVLAITRRPLTVTAASPTITYGAEIPTIGRTIIGFAPGENASVLSATITCDTDATDSSGQGSYITLCSGPSATGNYSLSYVTGTLTIDTADATVTADSPTIQFGDAIPTIGYTVTGLVKGENQTVITSSITCSTTATATSGVGTYPTSCAGDDANGNYTLSYVAGTLTITKAPVSVQVTGTQTYGGDPTFIVSGGLPDGVTATGPITCTMVDSGTPITAGLNAGAHSIDANSCTGLSADDNHTLTVLSGPFTVTPAALTVTAGSTTITYGDAIPAIEPTITGFVNGEDTSALNGTITCGSSAFPDSAAGNYLTACSGPATDGNYTLSYVGGTLTINRAALTVTAGSATITYGDAIPAIQHAITGFVNGEDASVLTATITCSTTATSTTGIGEHDTTCSGSATDGNYTLSYVGGTLTINRAALTVTAGSATITYGETIPAIEDTITGFVNGEDTSVLTATITCSATATAADDAGTYPTVCSGPATNGNYALTYVNGTLEINRAGAQLTAQRLSFIHSLFKRKIVFRATLVSSVTGSPVAGQQVTFRWGRGYSRYSATATTNANGVAQVTIPFVRWYQVAGLSSGYRVDYSGGTNYFSATAFARAGL